MSARTAVFDTVVATKSRRPKRGHGDGGLHQRADGRWEARVDLPDGKRKSVYGKTRREVIDKLRATQRSLEDGLDLNAGRLTVAQYLDRWLSASVKPSVREKTYEGYEGIVRVRVVPRIGRRFLAKLTALDLQSLYTELAAGGLSNRSVIHTHRVLHRAFEQAVRWNILARNPCDGVTPPKAARPEMRVFSKDEVTRLLNATEDHPAHAVYVLAVTTGMRIGELLGLRWEDVDLDSGRLAVRRALQRQNVAGLVFVEPKTNRSRRTVVLSKYAVAALRAHRDRQAFARKVSEAAWNERGLVFANESGGPLDPSWQRLTFYEALRAAGLPSIRFHDLRHTAATLLLTKGVHPKIVSEMLGHSTITLTLDTYSHLVPALHGHAADVMDDLLSA